MKNFTLILSVVLAGLFVLAPSTKVQAQQQCCCSAGCVGFGFGDCDSWCVVIGQTNAGSTSPYADPAACAAACSLPIELAYFKAEGEKDGVLLTWETAAEIENSGFEIQRMSGIKMAWESIGFVDGNGTTYETNEYTFLDDSPPPGTNYYRLKQVDFSGSSSLSSIEAVEKGDGQGLKLWPTLAKDHLLFGFKNQENFKDMHVIVVDMMGRTIISTEGMNDNYLDVQDLSEGHYLLNVYVNGEKYTERFVKVK